MGAVEDVDVDEGPALPVVDNELLPTLSMAEDGCPFLVVRISGVNLLEVILGSDGDVCWGREESNERVSHGSPAKTRVGMFGEFGSWLGD